MSRIKKNITALWDSFCWLKKRLTTVENCCVTCSGKSSGAGAQIQAVLSTMLFANELSIKYVHTPFKKIAHNIDNDKSYESKWESFTNLGVTGLAVDQIGSHKLHIVQVNHPRQIKKKRNTLYVITDCHKFADRNPNLYLKLMPTIRDNYVRYAKKPDLYFEPSKTNVAVHIRRGDVTKEDSSRYTSNSYVLCVIKEVASALSDVAAEPVFHIFSEGDMGEFSDLHLPGIIFHLNECPFADFHHMVSADVLVMAKSSFSYSAALFSKGIIMYLPFWHKPLRNWVVVKKNGGFDKLKFKGMIKEAATPNSKNTHFINQR